MIPKNQGHIHWTLNSGFPIKKQQSSIKLFEFKVQNWCSQLSNFADVDFPMWIEVGNFEGILKMFKSSLKFAYKSSFESLFDTSSTLNTYWILGLKISDSNLKVIFILCTRDWCIRNENFTLGDLFLFLSNDS